MTEIYVHSVFDAECGDGRWAYLEIVDGVEAVIGYGVKSASSKNQLELMTVLEPLIPIARHETIVVHTSSQYVLKNFQQLKGTGTFQQLQNEQHSECAELWSELFTVIAELGGDVTIENNTNTPYEIEQRLADIAIHGMETSHALQT